MRVRAGSIYRYNPVAIDRINPPYGDVTTGDIVRVKNMHGCPPANTMNYCYIVNVFTGEFIGLVCCNSLEPVADAMKRYVRARVKK